MNITLERFVQAQSDWFARRVGPLGIQLERPSPEIKASVVGMADIIVKGLDVLICTGFEAEEIVDLLRARQLHHMKRNASEVRP